MVKEERDVDYHNQKLRKRKLYREQRAKDHRKKIQKQFKHAQAEESKDDGGADDKQKQFYESLFTGEPENTPKPQNSERTKKTAPADAPQVKVKQTFNAQLDKIKQTKYDKELEKL